MVRTFFGDLIVGKESCLRTVQWSSLELGFRGIFVLSGLDLSTQILIEIKTKIYQTKPYAMLLLSGQSHLGFLLR